MADDLIPLSPVAPSRIRPRLRWRWARRLGALFVGLLALVWFAPAIAARTGLANWYVGVLLEDFNGSVRIDGASLGWLAPVELHGVMFTDPVGRTLLTAPKATLSKTLLELARNRSDLGTITVDQPIAEFVCENQTTNFEQAMENYFYGPSTGRRPALALRCTNGTLTLHDTDRARKQTLTAVETDVIIPAAVTEPIRVNVRSATGQLDLELSIGDDTTGTLKTTDFPLEAFELFGRRLDPSLALSGLLTTDAAFGLRLPDAGLPNFRLAGIIAARDFVLTSSRLGSEPLALSRVELPCVVTTSGLEIRVEKADLTCDLGTASFAGVIDLSEPVEKWLNRPNLRGAVDTDIAALAAMFPQAFHVREGLELREGRLRATLASQAGPMGTVWDGSIHTTSLKAIHNGELVVWDQPIDAVFTGRFRLGGVPAFDRLDVKAEFATITARGSPEQFTVTADVSLDQLATRLADFIDLGGVTLAGTAMLETTYKPNGKGGTTLQGQARLNRFAYADGFRTLREADLVVDIAADGRFDGASPIRLDSGRFTVTANEDALDVRLLEPVPDVRELRSGRVTAEVVGDLTRWWNRAGQFVALPPDWHASGTGKVAGTVRFDSAQIAFEKLTGELTALKFSGAGLQLDEPQVKIYPTNAVLDRASGRLNVGEFQFATQTIGLATRQIVLTPTTNGYTVVCTVLANANIARLQKALQLQTDPDLADVVSGLIQGGSLTLDTTENRYRFQATLPINNLTYGSPQNPTWAEPKLAVTLDGEYDPQTDRLRFATVQLERPAGLAVQARGTIGNVSTTQDLNLDGTIHYDLSLLEPQLRAYLGPSVRVVGRDASNFRISGPLSGQANTWAGLSGNAAIAWQSLRAYGFDVGPAELRATLDKGTLLLDPIEAMFGETGKVRLEPAVRFASTGHVLSFTKGRIIDRAKLTPAATADALGYALPAIARSSEAEGLISFDLDDNLIPLTDPERATVKGRLTLHSVQVGPGPVVTELATLFGARQTRLTLANEQVVPVRLENGRVYHEGMTLTANQFTLRTRGSVGLDGSLDLVAEVPVPENAVGPLLRNNPRIREAIAKKRFNVPVGGTIGKPRIDPRAFQDAVRRYVEEVGREAARNKLGDLIDKGQDRLEKGIEKKLDKLLPSSPPTKKQ